MAFMYIFSISYRGQEVCWTISDLSQHVCFGILDVREEVLHQLAYVLNLLHWQAEL